MRVLVIADIHDRLIGKPKEGFDAVFILGDITGVGDVSLVEHVLDFDCKVFAIPGNVDTNEVVKVLEQRGVSLHMKEEEFEGIKFVGFGGSNITPLHTPLEFDEVEIEWSIAELSGEVALFHTPPYGFFDDVNGRSIGSIAIMNWIEEKTPKIVFCAHVHEHQGVAKYKNTLIVKVGMAYSGEAAIVDFDKKFDKIAVRFVKI
ncbi:metallophosphoesterase [Archaeoglobales archaeon]|nr:MAG: metallophosphoesterase [Archaeoglobales archaeon]